MKGGIEYETNSFLQGKGFFNRGLTGEVKLLHALKMGDQEGENRLENHVPRKVWRINTNAAQYALCPGDSIMDHAGVHHPLIGSKEKNPLIHRLK